MANPYGMTEFSVPALIGLNEQIKGNRLEQLYRQKQMDFQDRQMAQQEKQWQLEERKRNLLSRIYGGGEPAQAEPAAQPQQPSPGVVSSPTPPAPGGDMGHYIAPDDAATMRKSLGAGYDAWKRKNNIYEDGDVPPADAAPATPVAQDMSRPPAAPVRNDGIQINQQALNELFAVDPDTAFQVQKFAAGAQKDRLEAMQAHGEVLAQASMYLKSFPAGPQRQAEFQRIIPDLVARGLTQDELTRADLSDNGIQRYLVFGQGLKDLVSQTQKDREFGLAQERVNIAKGALDLARGREGRMSSVKGGSDVSGASTSDLLRAAGF